MDRAIFYAALRNSGSGLFASGLSQSQVNGLERLLDTWASYYAADPIEFLSYDLATSYHETGATMQPVTENLNYSAERLRQVFAKYFTAAQAQAYARQPQRIANRAYANRNGNGDEASGDGWRFRGEGDVQNTGRANAVRATRELNAAFGLGIDLVADPDKRGDPFISAHSLFLGNKEGWWTGKRLGDYIKPGIKVDFVGSRAVVNGTDEDDKIAAYAKSFLSALKAAGPFTVSASPTPAPVPAPITPPVPVQPQTPIPATPSTEVQASFWEALVAIVISLFKKG
jgi:putative chitinase